MTTTFKTPLALLFAVILFAVGVDYVIGWTKRAGSSGTSDLDKASKILDDIEDKRRYEDTKYWMSGGKEGTRDDSTKK